MMSSVLSPKIVGNKAKGRIAKRCQQENKARQIFRKANISYPLIRAFDAHFLRPLPPLYVIMGVRKFQFHLQSSRHTSSVDDFCETFYFSLVGTIDFLKHIG